MSFVYKSKALLKALLKNAGLFKLFPDSASIIVAADFRMGLYPSITVSKKARIDIKNNVEMRRYCNVIVEEDAELIIEDHVFFNNYCSINCHEKIRIGANTIIGEGVKFYDHNHRYEVTPNFKIHNDQFTKSSIHVGRNCWIGSNVVILKGVTIGDNVIIGSNCLIYKSLPSNSIVKSKTELVIDQISRSNG